MSNLRPFFSLFLVLSSLVTFSQKATHLQTINARDFFEKKMIEILEKQNLLLNAEERSRSHHAQHWNHRRDKRRKKQKENYLNSENELRQELKNRFRTPSFIDDVTIDNNTYYFPNRAIELIGSYVLADGNLSIINDSYETDLPVLETRNQLKISPYLKASNYVLNYTTKKIFEGNLRNDASGGLSGIFNAKSALSANLEKKDVLGITIGAGVFKNQLAELYQTSIDQASNDPVLFGPLLDVWVARSNNLIGLNDSIIHEIEGFAFYTSSGLSISSDSEFKNNISYSAKFPFLSSSGDASANWRKSSDISRQEETYDIYAFKKPLLRKIPSEGDIYEKWKLLSSGSGLVNPGAFVELFPGGIPSRLEITFGPIPDQNRFQNLKVLNLDSIIANNPFIQKISIERDINKAASLPKNMYKIPVYIYRNDTYLRNNFSNISDGYVSKSIDLEIGYDVANVLDGIETHLDFTYQNIEVYTNLYPQFVSINSALSPNDIDNEGYYEYSTNIEIETFNNKNVSNLQFQKFNGRNEQLLTNEHNEKVLVQYSRTGNREYNLKIRLHKDLGIFSADNTRDDVEIVFKVRVNGPSSLRRIKVPVKAHPDQIKEEEILANLVTIENNENLVSFLNYDHKLNDSTSLDSVRTDFILKTDSVDFFDINKFVSRLQEIEVVNISADAKFLVDKKYLNFDAIRRDVDQ